MRGISSTSSLILADDRRLELDEFVDAVKASRPLTPTKGLLARLDNAYEAACKSADDRPVYGVSTGLGPMASVALSNDSALDLQYNLIRSHACGLGEPLSPDHARGMMLARLHSLTRNRSAVRGALVSHLATLMNEGLVPYVPRKGGVGASGDLVQLAHLGQLVIGEGKCFLHGCQSATVNAYAHVGLEPLPLKFRDGLALVNGTSAMVALGAFVCIDARRLFDLAVAMTCLLVEILETNREAYAEALHESRCHSAQRAVAQRMRVHLRDGARLPPLRSGINLQAPYSLRCAPQILGPFFDVLTFASGVITDELNSACDNPIFDPLTGKALHGGNFHGEGVALALDMLKIAIVKCSLLMERKLNLLLNDAVNQRLPPFLNLGRPGIELGLQGAQFTATSTAAENQTLAGPMSVHTIPSNKDNQDIVSMGSNAAWITAKTLDNAFDVAAVLALASSQAVAAANAEQGLSTASQRLLKIFREVVPPFHEDKSLSVALTYLHEILRAQDNGPFSS
jgi:histidine ammonia-lyase